MTLLAVMLVFMIIIWTPLTLTISELSRQDYDRVTRLMIVTLVVGVGLLGIGLPEVRSIGGVFLGITVGLFGFLLTLRHPQESPP